MKPDETEDESAGKFPEAEAALSGMGRRLEKASYPGMAWRAARGGRRAGWLGKSATGLIGLAAGFGLAVYLWPAGRPPVVVGMKADPAASHAAVAREIPRILIVEDADSYSVIDFSGETPVVAFSMRNSPMFESIVPIFSAPSWGAATQHMPM